VKTENYPLERFVSAGRRSNRLPLAQVKRRKEEKKKRRKEEKKKRRKERRERSINKCDHRTLEGVRRCPDFSCKSSTVSAAKEPRKCHLYILLGHPPNQHSGK